MEILSSTTTPSILKIILISFFLLFSFYTAPSYAMCNSKLDKKVSSCKIYKTRTLINTKNADIASVNNSTICIFQQECLSHQLCYDGTADSKKLCDKEFLSDIKYQCKVNFGHLVIIKKVSKRTRTCLKSTKKICTNLSRNCGQTCLVYGPDKIEVREIEKVIRNPHKSDYRLPGALFYPAAGYQACLAVAKGYKIAVSKMKARK